MDCQKAKALIPSYLAPQEPWDNPADKADLMAHIAMCESCRHEYEKSRKIVRLFQKYGQINEDTQVLIDKAGLKEKEAELTHKEAEFAEREQRLQEGEMALRQASISGFLDRLVREGRILPNQGPGLTAFMTSLNEAEQVAFSEPETGAPMIKTSSGAFIRTFLASLPVRVDYAERTAETGDKTDTIHFPIPDGFQVDPAGLKKHGQILAYANANNTDYLTAALAVS